jgi:hypothetical protein
MAAELMNQITRAEYEREIEVALDGSFPASDPPPWTFGVVVEPAPTPADSALASVVAVTDETVSSDVKPRSSER